MSRSGYNEDYEDNWQMIKWRGIVASATRGKRGQKLLRDLLAALDAMPTKRLIENELVSETGEVCALGALAKARAMDVVSIDPDDYEAVAKAFDIADPLAQEIAYYNDEAFRWDSNDTGDWRKITPEGRWAKMREWVASQIRS